MIFKKRYILILFLLLFSSMACVCANEVNDTLISNVEDMDIYNVDDTDFIESSSDFQNENLKESMEFQSDDGYIVYVGNNITKDGNGSYDNPFSTLKLACDNATGKNNVTVRIFGGTYPLGHVLNFDASTLKIEGVNGTVIIKNVYDRKANKNEYIGESFGSTTNKVNFTISNIIFDASDRTVGPYSDDSRRKTWFVPFYCGNKVSAVNIFGIFDNCSFVGFNNYNRITGSEYNSKFINCYFESTNSVYSTMFINDFVQNTNHTFEYCIFNDDVHNTLASIYLPCNISIDSVWFGQNNLPNYIGPFTADVANPDLTWNTTYVIPVNRYAQMLKEHFSITYLGNNQYEIVGKLTWNGTDNQDGMENFQPMTVNLVSTTGDINQTATLVNGNFRAVYTSSNINHKVTATLDDEEIELNFNNTDIVLDAPAIKYGEDQNITITFQQPINSTITITINNNKTYGVKVNESNSINFTIKDLVLTEGDYNISVSLIDEVNHIYGSNSTILSVSKYDTYIFVPEIVDTGDIKVGDNVTVKLVLPEDVSGNITVYINNNPVSTKDALKNNEINVTGLVAGDNTIIVTYNGNDKYASKSTEPQIVTVYKVSAYDFDVVVPTGVKVGEDTNITIKLPGDVSGNALVYIGNQDSITVPISGESTIVSVSGLVAGNNTVKVVFSDDKYAEKTLIKNITVEKLPVEITNNTIVVNAPTDSATPTVSIDIPGATGNLTVIINNKTFTAKLENGTATVTIKDVPAGTYNATVIYSGDDTFNQITTTASITVSEPKKQDNNNNGGQTNKVTKTATKIVAKKKTFKAKKKVKKYTITLKAGKKPVKKVWVTLKIKGKKLLKAKTNAKGKATFKIKKLTKKGKYKAIIKFKGNKNYKASSKKVKITIKK